MKRHRLLVTTIFLVAITAGSATAFFRSRTEPQTTNGLSSNIVSPLRDPTSDLRSPDSPPARDPLQLVFVGDIMLDRSVWRKMTAEGNDYPFAKADDLLAGADLVIGNLEGPITERGVHAQPGGTLLFKFEPVTATLLGQHGFDLVSLANNHTLNQGVRGLADTQTSLGAAGVTSFGQPREVGRDAVATVERGGWKLAFVGWNMIEVADTHETELLTLIRELDPTVDVVIVMPHWGSEYRPQTKIQTEAAHALIEAGADLIVGAHPHVVQGVEIYHDRLIAYSLGNFIFDQYWSPATQEGLLLEVKFDPNQITDLVCNLGVELVPIDLTASQPRLADQPLGEKILAGLLGVSDLADLPCPAQGFDLG